MPGPASLDGVLPRLLDAPTERFHPVTLPGEGLLPASADLPDPGLDPLPPDPEETRLIRALDAFDAFMAMSMSDRLAWTFGPASAKEPTPVWDELVLEMPGIPVGDSEAGS